jgi:signal transduction histidine kinase
VSRVPIRLRLTAAFAAAMLLVLAGAALFVYVSVRAELNESVTASARARADELAARIDGPPRRLGASGESLDPEEAFAQVVSPDGRLLEAIGGADEVALSPRALERAARGPAVLDAEVEGIEGTARVVARPAGPGPGSPVLVAGLSLDDRDETLAGLLATFAIGGPVAVVITSLLGYGLAAAGLAPVEAMRRRAAQVSLEDEDALPLPAANDEVRRLGETLNDMLERLRRSFEHEREFVADASHELRTPVAVLKTELEAALQAGPHTPEVAESLRAALEECDHLAQLAEDLQVLARSGDGKLPLHTETAHARTLLEDVCTRFAARARQEGRRVRIEAPEDLELRVDPLRMRQALGNLVDNGLRHGEGEIALGARPAGVYIELSASDQGPGFAPELHGRAFDRFTRGDAARTRGGAGLGLAIVRMIARAHGGEAEIVPGDGARVLIRVPRS